jgi:23S rRNA (guanosine2251-2'-O)-methyltransferase
MADNDPKRSRHSPRPHGRPEKRSDARHGDAKRGEPKRGEEKRGDAKRGDAKRGDATPWRGKHRNETRPKRPQWRPTPRDRDGPVLLYGWHSVSAALGNPARKFHRLVVSENALHRLREAGLPLPVEPELVRPDVIDALVGPDAVHQGLVAEADPLPSPEIDDLEPAGIVLVLDQITDPHNVGAILRSAAAFGVTAVITTLRHSPEATGVLAKAASGALEYVPMIAVPNLARALGALKAKNVFVVGLDSTGNVDLATVGLRAPLAIVLGAEGKGLRQLTRANCDQVARLELPGRIKSLNVSNATSLALYVAATQLAGQP